MNILSSRRFVLWTRELLRWLSRKFDSISIDLTPVENKLDDVKTAVEGITGYAMQGTDVTATNTAIRDLIIQQGIPYAQEYAAAINEIAGDWSESESES